MNVLEALAALAAAEDRLVEAQNERDAADRDVDVALAAEGWHRAAGAFPPEARFYQDAAHRLKTRAEAVALVEAAA